MINKISWWTAIMLATVWLIAFQNIEITNMYVAAALVIGAMRDE